MENDDRIPQQMYLELCELMGKEEAEKFIIKYNYRFFIIQLKILILRLKYGTKVDPITKHKSAPQDISIQSNETKSKKDTVKIVIITLIILLLVFFIYKYTRNTHIIY